MYERETVFETDLDTLRYKLSYNVCMIGTNYLVKNTRCSEAIYSHKYATLRCYCTVSIETYCQCNQRHNNVSCLVLFIVLP